MHGRTKGGFTAPFEISPSIVVVPFSVLTLDHLCRSATEQEHRFMAITWLTLCTQIHASVFPIENKLQQGAREVQTIHCHLYYTTHVLHEGTRMLGYIRRIFLFCSITLMAKEFPASQ